MEDEYHPGELTKVNDKIFGQAIGRFCCEDGHDSIISAKNHMTRTVMGQVNMKAMTSARRLRKIHADL